MADGGLEKIANAPHPSDCRWPASGGHLRTFFLRSHAHLGNDEFYKLCPWRVRHARHVCEPARGRVAWRGSGGGWFYRRLRALCSWRCSLSFAHSFCAARTNVVANTFNLRARAPAPLHGILDFFGEFRIAAANIA